MLKFAPVCLQARRNLPDPARVPAGQLHYAATEAQIPGLHHTHRREVR